MEVDMKNRYIIVILLVTVISSISTSRLYAQKFELTPFGGYFFAGKVTVSEGDLNVKNGGNYGFTMGMNIQPGLQVEFMFNRLDTRLVLKEWRTGTSRDLFDMSVNYFHLGAIYDAKQFEGGILFTNFSLGATLFAPTNVNFEDKDGNLITSVEDDWRFSIGFGGGIKKYLSDKIGLRLQLRVLMPIYWAGGSIYVGSGGAGFGLGAGTALVQGDATVGLIIRL
jgi:hypothetical protein